MTLYFLNIKREFPVRIIVLNLELTTTVVTCSIPETGIITNLARSTVRT
jgi:hypothetical protein